MKAAIFTILFIMSVLTSKLYQEKYSRSCERFAPEWGEKVIFTGHLKFAFYNNKMPALYCEYAWMHEGKLIKTTVHLTSIEEFLEVKDKHERLQEKGEKRLRDRQTPEEDS